MQVLPYSQSDLQSNKQSVKMKIAGYNPGLHSIQVSISMEKSDLTQSNCILSLNVSTEHSGEEVGVGSSLLDMISLVSKTSNFTIHQVSIHSLSHTHSHYNISYFISVINYSYTNIPFTTYSIVNIVCYLAFFYSFFFNIILSHFISSVN